MTTFQPHGMSRRPSREVRDTRKPLYTVFVLDTSSSMSLARTVGTGEAGTHSVRKIDELNDGVKLALDSLRRFEASNVLYKVYVQIIELNSYGRALFPDFVPLSSQTEQVSFKAAGVTCLESTLSTLKTALDPKHLPGCNRAVNVILMSDGQPTDVGGYTLPPAVYEKLLADFRAYLVARKIDKHVECYSIGVGDDACEPMLRAFAGEGHYYAVEDMESLAEKLDFVTRCSIAGVTSRPVGTSQGHSVGTAATSGPDSFPAFEMPKIREIDVSRCLGTACTACMDTCLMTAIVRESGLTVIQPELCIGCGSCDTKCPVDAIHVVDDGGSDGTV